MGEFTIKNGKQKVAVKIIDDCCLKLIQEGLSYEEIILLLNITAKELKEIFYG